jgi:hypothetical protein
MMTRLAGNKEGKGEGGKGSDNSNEGTGKEEGKGGKAMALATRVAGKWMATGTKRVMAMKMTEAGKEEGNGCQMPK